MLAKRRLTGVLLAFSLLIIFAGALCACGTGAATSAGSQPSAAVDDRKPAPTFSGVTLDGKTLTLDQYRGKPLLLVYMTST